MALWHPHPLKNPNCFHLRLRLQVFASVFKPAAEHLLANVTSWEQEIAPLLLAGAPLESEDAAEAAALQKQRRVQRRALGIDGLFADSPGLLREVYKKYACGEQAYS